MQNKPFKSVEAIRGHSTRPMLGFKSFEAAQGTLVGIELMHMLKTGQMAIKAVAESLTPAVQFYALAA